MSSTNIRFINVTFDPTQPGQEFTWGEPLPVQLPAVTNDTSMYALVFTLNPQNAEGATWAPNPMDWGEQGVPPPIPRQADMPFMNANQFVIGIDNTNTENQPKKFGFEVSVEYNGNRYTSHDPEVVLQPPS
jgi:hypothetical protein